MRGLCEHRGWTLSVETFDSMNALAIEKLFLVPDVPRNSRDCRIELWLDRLCFVGDGDLGVGLNTTPKSMCFSRRKIDVSNVF